MADYIFCRNASRQALTQSAIPSPLHLLVCTSYLQENGMRVTRAIPSRSAFLSVHGKGALSGLWCFCLPLGAQAQDPLGAGALPANRIAGHADHPGWLLTRKPGTQTAGSEARAGGIPRFAWRAATGVPISQHAIGLSISRMLTEMG